MTKLFTSALALLIATSTFENFTLADDDIEESINCIDLTPFVDDHHDMSVLAGGGSVPDDGPAIFHIPSTFISGEMVYCLENIPIPDMVGSNKCQDSDQCWLAVGLLADDESDQDDRAINSCKDSVTGDTGNCYNCACTGTSMSTGSLSRLQRNACGLSSDSSWGVSCTEANNGRIDWINDKPNPSNVSTVHVSVCAGSQSTCYVCAGGLHPSFKVGVQWISNLEEQCFNNPFSSYDCSTGLSTRSKIAIGVGAVILLVVMIISIYLCCRSFRNNNNKNKSSSQKQQQQPGGGSVHDKDNNDDS